MKKDVILVAAVLAVLFGVCIYSGGKRMEAVRPPEGVTRLEAFLTARPNPLHIQKFTQAGVAHIAVTGEAANVLLSLPSWPPVYVFDENGTLVDWTADSGDDSSFWEKWDGLKAAESINAEEAVRLTDGHGGGK